MSASLSCVAAAGSCVAAAGRASPAQGGPARRGRRGPAGLAVAALATAIACAGLTGCAAFDKALSQQWAVGQFQSGTPTSEILAVRSACSHVAGVTPAPLAQARRDALGFQVTFVTTKASDADLSALQTCLSRFRSFAGMSLQDAGSGQ